MNLHLNLLQLILCLVLLQSAQSRPVKKYAKWYNKPETSAKDSFALQTNSTEESIDLPATTTTEGSTLLPTTTATPGRRKFVPGKSNDKLTRKTKQKIQTSKHCETLVNGTEVCRFKCPGQKLECTNGGVCVLDDNSVPVCSCKHARDYVFTGPHCEHRLKTSPLTSSHPRRVIVIVLGIACGLSAILFLLNIAIVVYYKRRRTGAQDTGTKRRYIEFEVTTMDSQRSNNGGVFELSNPSRSLSNHMYFENTSPGADGIQQHSVVLDDFTFNAPFRSSTYDKIM